MTKTSHALPAWECPNCSFFDLAPPHDLDPGADHQHTAPGCSGGRMVLLQKDIYVDDQGGRYLHHKTLGYVPLVK